MKRIYPFTYYMAYFAALSFNSPFIVLFFQGLGFSALQVGLLTGLAPLVSMVSGPLWTWLADRKRRHNQVMGLTLLASIGLAVIFPWLKTFPAVIVLVILFFLCIAPVNSFADSATMNMLGNEKDMYGRVRLGGTIGWGVVAPVAGWMIQSYGIKLAFWGFAAIMFLAFLISRKFTFAHGTTTVPIQGNALKMLINRRWVFFLCLAFVGGIAVTSINTYLSPYMEELGASKTAMGIALTIATVGELPILFFANRLLKRFGAYGLFVVGLIITGLRLLLYAAFNFTAGVLIFQLLNGMTYPMVWVAAVSFADQNSAADMKATAQGVLGAVAFGIGGAAGGLVGGLLRGSIGGRGMFLVMGIFVLAGVGVTALLEKADRTRTAVKAV